MKINRRSFKHKQISILICKFSLTVGNEVCVLFVNSHYLRLIITVFFTLLHIITDMNTLCNKIHPHKGMREEVNATPLLTKA